VYTIGYNEHTSSRQTAITAKILLSTTAFILKHGLSLTTTTLKKKFTTILMIININDDSRIPEDSRLLRRCAVSLQL
jgi:hypothetical protein